MTHAASPRRVLVVVACGALMVTLSMGIRQSFGIFQEAISSDLGTGREVFGLTLALQNLMLGLPLVGLLTDRIGARWVALFGGLLYAVALVLTALAGTAASLYVTFGLLVGVAVGATAYVVVLGAVAQVVPPDQRSTAFGITTAAGSFGMFALPPAAQWFLSAYGWQTTFFLLAGLSAGTALLALGFPGRTGETDGTDQIGQTGQTGQGATSIPATPEAHPLIQVLRQARGHSGYWLLNAGFFVCGFHVAFIATHLPAYLTDNGIDPFISATALALIGFANISGSYLFGMLGDRVRKKYLLGWLYFARAIVISLFLLLPLSAPSALIFGGVIGFLWLATVPLTSGIVAHIFGSRYLATLYGIVFFSHQIGGFLGAWLGGRLYDTTGSYTVVWLVTVLLSLMAALLHLPISDTPLAARASSNVQGAPISPGHR
jgi:MFS family permease